MTAGHGIGRTAQPTARPPKVSWTRARPLLRAITETLDRRAGIRRAGSIPARSASEATKPADPRMDGGLACASMCIPVSRAGIDDGRCPSFHSYSPGVGRWSTHAGAHEIRTGRPILRGRSHGTKRNARALPYSSRHLDPSTSPLRRKQRVTTGPVPVLSGGERTTSLISPANAGWQGDHPTARPTWLGSHGLWSRSIA